MRNEKLIAETIGVVETYNRKKGFGWIKPYYKHEVGAFISHRNIIQEIDGTKNLFPEQYVSMELYQNDRGYEAKNVKQITQSHYEELFQRYEDLKYNKEEFNKGKYNG